MKCINKKKITNFKKNKNYLNLLIRKEKKYKIKLLNFENNLCYLVTNLKCYIIVI